MFWKRKVLICVALAVASTAALAFQEERQVQGGQAQQAAPTGGEVTVPLSPADVPGPSAKGTEVTIPGLGTVGVLPKVNFGLDLLYGAAEPKRAEEAAPDNDGLTIRGSIKHRF